MRTERRTFEGGSNSDIDPKLLSPNQYIEGENIKISPPSSGKFGRVSKTRKSRNTSPTEVAGTHARHAEGRCDDRARNTLYWFISGFDGTEGCIARREQDSATTTRIYVSDYLEITKGNKITDSTVLTDGDELFLIWTNGVGEVKFLSVNRAINGDYDTIPNLSYKHFNLIPYKPLAPPIIDSVVLPNLETSAIDKNLWQFKYQWIFWDNRETAWSPASKIGLPYGAESVYTVIHPNAFEVTVYRDSDTASAFIKTINVAARKAGSANSGDWYQFLSIDMDQIADSDYLTSNNLTVTNDKITLYFTGTETPVILVQNKVTRLFDYLPWDVKALCDVDNTLFLANGVTNYDNPTDLGDTQLSILFNSAASYGTAGVTFTESVSIPTAATSITGTSSTSGVINEGGFFVMFIIPVDTTSRAGRFVYRFDGFATNAGTALADLVAQVEAYDFGGGFVINTGSTASTATTITVVANNDFYMSCKYVLSARPTLSQSLISAAQVGFVYGDEGGRCETVVTNDNLQVMRTWPGGATSPGPAFFYLTINHLGPSWATWFSISIKLTKPRFVMVTVNDATALASGEIELDISAFYSYCERYNTPLLQSFTTDMRVRLYWDASAGEVAVNGQFSMPITNVGSNATYGANGITIGFYAPGAIIAPAAPDVILIYVPESTETSEDTIWHETGEVYPLSAEGYHLCADDTYTTPSSTNSNQTGIGDGDMLFYAGDSYAKLVARSSTLESPTQTSSVANQADDPNFSDFWISNGVSIGNANVVDINIREHRNPVTIWNSQVLTPFTNINGLGTFIASDFRDADIKYVSIQHLHSTGEILYIAMESKIGYSRIRKNVLFDASGTQTVEYTNALLSPIDYIEKEYGIGQVGESWGWTNRACFFLDPRKREVCYLEGTSLESISVLGKRGVFYDLLDPESEATAVFSKWICWGACSTSQDEYLISVCKERGFVFTLATPSDTIVLPSWVDMTVINTNGAETIDFYNNSGALVTTATILSVVGNTLTLDVTIPAASTRTTYLRSMPTIWSFNTLLKRWTTKYNYFDFEIMATIGENSSSALFKTLSIHDQLDTFVEEASISVPFSGINNENKGSQQDKVYILHGVAMESDTDWVGEDADYNVSTPAGQMTFVRSALITQKEGFRYTPVRRDRNTPNAASGDIGEINGNEMRSPVFVAKLKTTSSTSDADLMAFVANLQESPMTYG